ncbi:MAG: hypothetical protein FJY85_17810, partial [Deltaproteobacteria bacterium]|nr:hypothetical protein [Deltaproteobacteria bacterium]
MTLRFKRAGLLVLIVVLVLFVWGALRHVPVVFDLNTYKGYLEARLTGAIGHPVQLGQLQLSLLRGVHLRVLGLKVLGENGEPELLRVSEVSA